MVATPPDTTSGDRRRPLPHRPEAEPAVDTAEPAGTGRRRFLGYLLAGPTLIAAAPLAAATVRPREAGAVVPAVPELADEYDLSDLLRDSMMPTSNLITVTVHPNGTATFALPRAEVGQGITTSTTMIIADELDLPVDKIEVTLADARPELMFNQLTGGSSATYTTYHPIRTAAALARTRLIDAAAAQWKLSASTLTTHEGYVIAPDGRRKSYGSLAVAAAAAKPSAQLVPLKAPTDRKVVGTPLNRVDALEAVTGRKPYAMDLAIPGALPTMVCRPPTINGTVRSVGNLAAVRAMPGITDVAVISTGVAVRGRTFGQCIDAVRALRVQWNPGPVDNETDATILARLRKAEVPLAVPSVPLLAKTVEGDFVFHFRSNSPLETNCAVADVRADSAEIWSSMKIPIVVQQTIAQNLGLPQNAVTCHVVQGGGSFGRHLFADAAYEAAEASRAFGNKPVRLMWHRTDDFRHGRTHPMCTSRVRATVLGQNVLTYEQRHTSVATDFTHGLGEILTAMSAKLPGGNLGFAQSIFELTANVSYNYGVTTQVLDEIFDYDTFHTGSMRNVYSPDVCTAQELVTDRIATLMGKDPVAFRLQFARDARMKAVIQKAAQVGRWGKPMPAGTAQGIAIHSEYKGRIACLVEIDTRPVQTSRKIYDAWTGPRVTNVTIAVDVGLPINPKGLEAQMIGGAMDGIAQTLTSSLHLRGGYFAEGSWDNYWYTRQWNSPPQMTIVVMPPSTGEPGGAGEFAVGVTQAAVACAYARATGTMPTEFPINHHQAVDYDVLPTVPPIPQSPTNGLQYAY